MKHRVAIFLCMLLTLGAAGAARGDNFADRLNLAPLRIVAVQNNQTMKTLDTFARQALEQITGHGTLDGREPVYTLLDMTYRPEQYVDRNIIKISSVPLREEFLNLPTISDAEQQRIMREGTVSLTFLLRQDVIDLFRIAQASSMIKSKAISQVFAARDEMRAICQDNPFLIPADIIPPAPGSEGDGLWHAPVEFIAYDPEVVAFIKSQGATPPAPPAGYEDFRTALSSIMIANGNMVHSWRAGNAKGVNKSIAALVETLPTINPASYPSVTKRKVEVIYNRLARLTLPGSALYLIAFVLFITAAQAEVPRLRLWGLRFMVVAFAIHTLGIAVRWWLVGGIFPPIKNEFESVMFSAWFGAAVGLGLELFSTRGLFGAAASFVGSLALLAIFAAPLVTGTEIGGEIGQVQGILMSYWLYVHVTMVTASYALIGMGFLLSCWWLLRYYARFGTFRRLPGNLISRDALPAGAAAADGDWAVFADAGGAISLRRTLAMMLFLKRPQPAAAPIRSKAAAAAPAAERTFLALLDQCNLVILQLAFWTLGIGIILGAIWADQSWGRPWGWDPKETFALVTWMVYLVIVHVRSVTLDKAWWTAVLAFFGFFIMLFNWIGVNFFLVGLHSYA